MEVFGVVMGTSSGYDLFGQGKHYPSRVNCCISKTPPSFGIVSGDIGSDFGEGAGDVNEKRAAIIFQIMAARHGGFRLQFRE